MSCCLESRHKSRSSLPVLLPFNPPWQAAMFWLVSINTAICLTISRVFYPSFIASLPWVLNLLTNFALLSIHLPTPFQTNERSERSLEYTALSEALKGFPDRYFSTPSEDASPDGSKGSFCTPIHSSSNSTPFQHLTTQWHTLQKYLSPLMAAVWGNAGKISPSLKAPQWI